MKRLWNMSFMTNAIAVLVTVIGYFSPVAGKPIFDMGIFALSGAITNWLAIYMLFEKVPFLYGSGIIPLRFEEFKLGIRALIMEQFFTPSNIERFFHKSFGGDSGEVALNLSGLVEGLDYDLLFSKLVQAVSASSLGPMLAMFGGENALASVKAPFMTKMRESLGEMAESPNFQTHLQEALRKTLDAPLIVSKVEGIVQSRLDELTPQMVKEIIEAMIHKHLGWLVVWGGVFGGLIGLVASFLS